jgi:hypothetical protein
VLLMAPELITMHSLQHRHRSCGVQRLQYQNVQRRWQHVHKRTMQVVAAIKELNPDVVVVGAGNGPAMCSGSQSNLKPYSFLPACRYHWSVHSPDNAQGRAVCCLGRAQAAVRRSHWCR